MLAPAIVSAALASAYGSFTNVKCEGEKTIADIMESAKSLKFANGRRVFNEVSNVKIITSRTVRPTRNELVCHLKVRMVQNGSYRTITGRHTVHLYDDGRWRANFKTNN